MVNELSSLFGPNQLAGGVNSTEEVAEGTCAVLRQSLSGKGSIEQVLTALTVLYALLAEDAVQLVGRHTHTLCHLRGGEA